MLGLNAVAAPIFDAHDACIAALAIVGSIQFLPEKPRQSDVAQLIEAARQISRKLGHGRSADQPAVSKRGARELDAAPPARIVPPIPVFSKFRNVISPVVRAQRHIGERLAPIRRDANKLRRVHPFALQISLELG